ADWLEPLRGRGWGSRTFDPAGRLRLAASAASLKPSERDVVVHLVQPGAGLRRRPRGRRARRGGRACAAAAAAFTAAGVAVVATAAFAATQQLHGVGDDLG